MLNPNNDRLDYGEILTPPAGYYLDFAVGTTYSLNLDALVGVTLSLGLSEETDSELMDNPICLLEALRSTGDKVALFCEGGQIHMPSNPTALYILLEKMVFPVSTAKASRMAAYPSFHPKFWLIRYINESGDLKYRVVVLSRNLTFDRNWDIAYCMDGIKGKTAIDKNQPLADFLEYLVVNVADDENGREKADKIRSLINELPYIVFEPTEKAFYDYEFIPNGVKKTDGTYYCFKDTDLFRKTFHEILIISPFLSGEIIRDFNIRNKDTVSQSSYTLITRELSLGKLKPEDVSNFKIYTMKDAVVDGEESISEDAAQIRKQDIHAKMYMFRKYSDADLYLGSLNASHNAVYGNIEFMLRLKSKARYLNKDKLETALFGNDKNGADNPFQEVTLQTAIIDEDDEKQKILDEIIKQIVRQKPTAVVSTQDDKYAVSIHFGECDIAGYKINVKPLLFGKTEDFSSMVRFEGMDTTQLSEFYVLTVSNGNIKTDRILLIPTEGMPKNREKTVVSSVIKDRDCFYRYIAFLLGDDAILSVLEGEHATGQNYGLMQKSAYRIPALYEKMLQTAAISPEKFRGIEYLLKTISDDDIIPNDFKELFEIFRKAVKADA